MVIKSKEIKDYFRRIHRRLAREIITKVYGRCRGNLREEKIYWINYPSKLMTSILDR